MKYEPCPQCREMGRDTRGDNLVRYPDGGAHCFSCGYHEAATVYRGKSRAPNKFIPILEETLPAANMAWLRRYGLTDEEIKTHFKYAPAYNRHIFVHIGTEGEAFWEARTVNKSMPKVTSFGAKPFLVMGKGSSLVFVEDIVSAIKVARHAMVMPLFGCAADADTITKAVNLPGVETVYVWLDDDKKTTSMEIASIAGTFKPCYHIFTANDPKEHTDEEIIYLVS